MASLAEASNQREIRVHQFVLTMWLKDKNQKLEGSILRDKLKLDVKSLQCAADARGWLIVLLKTQSKRRSNEILKFLVGEEALKAMKQPAAMNTPAINYNLCVPSDGHKIQGIDGIEIYAHSKDTKNEFEAHSNMLTNIKNGTAAGKYFGEWRHDASPPDAQIQEQQRQWAMDDAVQQQVMREDPAAFGLDSSGGGNDTESDEEEDYAGLTTDKRPAPTTTDKAGQAQQQQTKRTRTSQQAVNRDPSALAFAEKFMEFQRNDAEKHADLRVKLAEMTYASKLEVLAERLKRAEAHGLEMEARLKDSESLRLTVEARLKESESLRLATEADHAKAVTEFTQARLDSETLRLAKEADHAKAVAEITRLHQEVERHRLEQKQAEALVEKALETSETMTEELRASLAEIARLKASTRDAIGQLLQDLELTKSDFLKATAKAEEALWYEQEKNFALKDHCRRFHKTFVYTPPDHLTAQIELLEIENRTLRARLA